MHEQLQQLRMYLSGMWKYRWFGIAASWIVCIGIWTFVYLKPDVYEASGKIQIDLNTALRPILKGLAVESDQSDTVNIMTKQLMSRPVLERIIRETDLGLSVNNELQMEGMIKHLRETIGIHIPKSDDKRSKTPDTIVTISYKDPRPKLAYGVVKKVIDTLVERTLGANQTDTDVAHTFLRSQIKDYEARLYAAEQKLAEFKKKNVGIMPGQEGGYYSRLQNASDGLRKIESDLQLATNKVKILKTQIQQEVARSVTASYDKKIQEHEDKLNSLLLQFTDNHPDVQAEKSIIASLKKSKQEAIQNAASDSEQNDDSLQLDQVYQNLQIALKQAEVNVSNIEASRAEQKKLISTLQKQLDTAPEVEAQLARLNRDYEITKSKYTDLVSRLDSARISSQAEKSSEDINFKVIEPPIVPIIPVGPNRLLFNSAAIAAGIAAFFALTFLILQLRPVFLTRKELAHATGLPVLGTITMVLDQTASSKKKKERVIMVLLGLAQLAVFSVIIYYQH